MPAPIADGIVASNVSRTSNGGSRPRAAINLARLSAGLPVAEVDLMRPSPHFGAMP
jgi:hypothetical protein